MDIRKELINAMEMKGIKQGHVAKSSSIKEGRLSEFLKKDAEIAFDIVLKIVRNVAPDKEFDLMESYSNEVTTPKNIKYALEYCSAHRLFKSLEGLISTSEDHHNSDLKSRADTYKINYKWQTLSFDNEEDFYQELRFHRTSSKEMLALQLVIECHLLRKTKQNKLLKPLVKVAEEKLEDIKDEFIKTSLICRLNEVIGIVELKIKCNFDKVKDSANTILKLDNGSTYNGYAYYLLAMSELKNDFSKSLNLFNQAISEYKKSGCFHNVRAMKGNISLLHFFWGKVQEDEANSVYNTALRQESVDEVIVDGLKSTPFGRFLRGYAERQLDLMLSSISGFVGDNDYFFADIAKSKTQEIFDLIEIPQYIEDIIQSA